jgi:Flp pilus assembly secretin CpaC
LAIFVLLKDEISAAEKLMIPLAKSVAIPANGVKKIMAVKEGIVEVLNVSDEEIIVSGVGENPARTQLILWDKTGRRVYDVETYSETDIIQAKFASVLDNPAVKLVLFPDTAYLKGQVSSEAEKQKAQNIASSLISDKKIVNLIEFEVTAPSLQQRIQSAIKLPGVKVNVISANFDPRNPNASNALVATDTTNLRIVLHGKVKDQNDYIHLTETVKGFVASPEQVSNLVVIEHPIQVVFQAFILQVSKNNTKDLGIEWGKASDDGGVVTGVLGFIENASNHFRGDTQSLGAPVPENMNPLYMNNINRFDLIAAQVKAWETSGKAKVLANPKLTVYANASPLKIAQSGWLNENKDFENESDIEKDSGIAFVNVGQKIFYSTGQNLTTGQTNYAEVDASLKLSIRDMFVNQNELKFSVFAKQQEPSFLRGNDGPPDILNRSIMTTLKLKDQQTVVLGGLINRTDNVSWKEVPVLGRLPLVGRLFRTKNTSKSENELVILLTPKIISNETDLSGNKRFKEVPVPRRSDKLEKLHDIFQQIKSSHLPAHN